MAKTQEHTHIGISGWNYEPWRGTFYPEDLAQKNELHFASRALNTIEINGTFYSLQKPKIFKHWYEETPDNFIFSVKAHRYITHIKLLKNAEEGVVNFFRSGILELKEKLGPILWQLPPRMKFDFEKLEKFLKFLPRDFSEAVKLAKSTKYRHWRKGADVSLKIDKNRPLHHAMEVRNDSFKDKKFITLLKKYNVALAVADAEGTWPYFEELTSDFMYCRLHGKDKLYESGYDKKTINKWAKKLSAWRKKREVFVYFDNTDKVKAPDNARTLSRLLKA
ncbi:MAG: DUF72 domain-containing protein [Pseudobdellovibrio sp.]|nr:DUF72 domain-containing protein [Pseudobdellovibrio sp.]